MECGGVEDPSPGSPSRADLAPLRHGYLPKCFRGWKRQGGDEVLEVVEVGPFEHRRHRRQHPQAGRRGRGRVAFFLLHLPPPVVAAGRVFGRGPRAGRCSGASTRPALCPPRYALAPGRTATPAANPARPSSGRRTSSRRDDPTRPRSRRGTRSPACPDTTLRPSRRPAGSDGRDPRPGGSHSSGSVLRPTGRGGRRPAPGTRAPPCASDDNGRPRRLRDRSHATRAWSAPRSGSPSSSATPVPNGRPHAEPAARVLETPSPVEHGSAIGADGRPSSAPTSEAVVDSEPTSLAWVDVAESRSPRSDRPG